MSLALNLGEMSVFGDWSPKMLKALAVISVGAHAAYDALPDNVKPTGGSRDLCLFMSLAIRDFLVGIGYRDATVRTCGVVIDGQRDGVELRSIGIGMPGDPDRSGKFNGHAGVEIPSLKFLLDPTLGQAKRDRFPDLPGMMALPIVEVDPPIIFEGLKLLTGFEREDGTLRVAYFDRSDIDFRRQLDYLDPRSRERRRAVARTLSQSFAECYRGEP